MSQPMRFTLTFMTGRQEPLLGWVLDDLRAQLQPGDEVDLLVVDALHGSRPLPELGEPELHLWLGDGRHVHARHVAPKPNIWQGRHRVTRRDWWATANARNTAIALAATNYLVFLDDRSHLGPEWLVQVRRGYAARDAVLAGAYEKNEGKPGSTRDHRLGVHPSGKRNCGGGWLYGCTFCLPLEWALRVNGLEEGCDSLTGEDYIFGLMLGNAGYRIDYEPRLFVTQDRTFGTEHGFAMTDKGQSPRDKSHAALDRFGKRDRTEFTPDLREIRRVLAEGGNFPAVDPSYEYRDWYDGQLVREMEAP